MTANLPCEASKFAALQFLSIFNKQRNNCLGTYLHVRYNPGSFISQPQGNEVGWGTGDYNYCVIDGQWFAIFIVRDTMCMGNESYQFGMDNEGSRVVIHVVLDGKER